MALTIKEAGAVIEAVVEQIAQPDPINQAEGEGEHPVLNLTLRQILECQRQRIHEKHTTELATLNDLIDDRY